MTWIKFTSSKCADMKYCVYNNAYF